MELDGVSVLITGGASGLGAGTARVRIMTKAAASIARNRYLNGEVIRLDGGIRMPPR